MERVLEYRPGRWRTGFTDRNGKDICNGDIVRLVIENQIKGFTFAEFPLEWGKYRIAYFASEPHLQNTMGDRIRLADLPSVYTMEVIGNIVDTPALL